MDINEFLARKRAEHREPGDRGKPADRATWLDRVLHVARDLAAGTTQRESLAAVGVAERTFLDAVAKNGIYREILDLGRSVALAASPGEKPAALRTRFLEELRRKEKSQLNSSGRRAGRPEILEALGRARQDEARRGDDAAETALLDRAAHETAVARLAKSEEDLTREVRELREEGFDARATLKLRELSEVSERLRDAKAKLRGMPRPPANG